MSTSEILEELEAILPSRKDGPKKPLDSEFQSRMKYLKAKFEWKIFSCLNEPATEEDLNNLEKEMAPYVIPSEVVKLYKLANGDTNEGVLKPGNSYFSINSAIEMRSVYKESAENEYPKELFRFLPIIGAEKFEIGVFLKEYDYEPAVYGIDIWDGKLFYMASSLRSLLKARLNCHKNNVFKRGRCHSNDPHNYLKKEKEIVENIEGPNVYPISKKKGITIFSIWDSNTWPSDINHSN